MYVGLVCALFGMVYIGLLGVCFIGVLSLRLGLWFLLVVA